MTDLAQFPPSQDSQFNEDFYKLVDLVEALIPEDHAYWNEVLTEVDEEAHEDYLELFDRYTCRIWGQLDSFATATQAICLQILK